MSIPVQVTFRHMPRSPHFETRIRELVRRLEKFSSRITSCHVLVEKPHQSSTQGGLFDVHLSVCTPGNIIVVRRSHVGDPEHANAYVALRDAYNAAKRSLQDYEKGLRQKHRVRPEKPAAADRLARFTATGAW
jgi:ribosome-associated translation inhibitor RaiA